MLKLQATFDIGPESSITKKERILTRLGLEKNISSPHKRSIEKNY